MRNTPLLPRPGPSLSALVGVVSPSVMAIGEAAGVTAALAATGDIGIADVDANEVQRRLERIGAIRE